MANIFDLFKKIESSSDKAPITHIVAGLGNVGKEYECTRHNAGFMAIDALAEKCGVRIDRVKFHALGERHIPSNRRSFRQAHGCHLIHAHHESGAPQCGGFALLVPPSCG